MTTLGIDSHIILQHTDVNSGDPYGFILTQDDRNQPAITLQRELESDGTTNIRLFFEVLCADDLLNPNGSRHAASRSDDYAMLEEYLSCEDGISVTTPVGTFSAIGASGHTATESHFPSQSRISIQLNNVGTYYSPADAEKFLLSVWDGTLTWATSYWR